MAAHVNPFPDPDSFWPFTEGQTRVIKADAPLLSFQVVRIGSKYVEGVQILGEQRVCGFLVLNHPCVICRHAESSAPLVTLTLRKVEGGNAYLQVTASPDMRVGWRV